MFRVILQGDLPLGESEIHADVCRVQVFLKGFSIPQMQFRFSYLVINTESLVPLNSENLMVRFSNVVVGETIFSTDTYFSQSLNFQV